jgi:hypothetical protein
MRESGASLRSKVALRSHLTANRTAHNRERDGARHTRENGRMVGLQAMGMGGQIDATILGIVPTNGSD